MLTPNISMGGDLRAQFSTGFGDNAVLYLFSKRYLPDQYRRSFAYNFNQRVTDAISERVERVSTVGGISPGACFLRDTADAAAAILPEASGQLLNTNMFKEAWTFLLIVDHTTANSGSPFMQTASAMPNVTFREIYSGWVMDEPVSTDITNFAMGYRHNPGAVFSITHHTKLSSTGVMMASGMCNTTSVVVNNDFVNGQTAEAIQINPGNAYDLRPEKVASGISCDTGFDGSRQFVGSVISNNRQSVAVNGALNNPAQHMKHIVAGLCDTSRLYRTPSEDIGFVPDTGSIASTLSGQLAMGDGRFGILNGDLDPSVPFNFDSLDKRYPGLQVQVIRQQSGPTVDYLNSGVATQQNVMNSLISAALPDIMVNAGLGDVAFTYCSWMNPPMGTNLPGEDGTFEFQDVGPLYQTDPNVLMQHCDEFRRSLFLDLFPIIRSTCGEFYLMVRSSISGETLIKLNLMDWGTMNQNGYYEQSNRFGGLNTGLVGAGTTFENNANQLTNVIQTVTQSCSMPTGMFDYPSEFNQRG